MTNILPITKATKDDRDLIGVKASSLAFLQSNQVPVPDGFIITTEMMDEFLEQHNLVNRIKKELNFLDKNNPKSHELTSQRIKKLIKDTPMSRSMSEEIWKAYETMGKNVPVSVRTSPLDENYLSASYPLFLNVKGEVAIAELVKDVWMGQFSPNFLATNNNPTGACVAVIVQRMINADASGYIHTVERNSNNKTLFEIEAILGIGELLVQDRVKPDSYIVEKTNKKVVEKIDRDQEFKLIIKDDEVVEKKLSKKELEKEILSERQIENLVEMVASVDKNSYYPQTLEWVMYHDQIYILQTQDVELPSDLKVEENSNESVELNLEIVSRGVGVRAGISTGKVQFINDAEDKKKIDEGEIVLVDEVDPDMMNIFSYAAGIVVQKGEGAKQIGLLASELDIPAIVGVTDLKKIFKQGQVITIDGANGYIYGGSPDLRGKGIGFSRQEFLASVEREMPKVSGVKTAAKVYVDVADGKNLKTIKNLDIDGLCYIKGENVIGSLGIHPKKLIFDKKGKMISKVVEDKLAKVCKEIEGDVFYRISDYQNTSYDRLKNGGDWEMEEENKLLGYRGGLRHLVDDRVLMLELKAVAKVYSKYKNLKLVMPFLRTLSELEIMKKVLAEMDLDCEVWLWAGSPSNLILLPEFINRGIDGFMIDMEHLATLVLGVDGSNTDVNRVFSQMDTSVLWLVERANQYANSQNIPCVLVSKYAGVYNEFVDRMVAVGVDGFSVPFDMVGNTRRLVAKAEEKRFG